MKRIGQWTSFRAVLAGSAMVAGLACAGIACGQLSFAAGDQKPLAVAMLDAGTYAALALALMTTAVTLAATYWITEEGEKE